MVQLQFTVTFDVEEDDQPRTEEVVLGDEERDGASPEERAVVAAAHKSSLTHVETRSLTVEEVEVEATDEWRVDEYSS